MTVQTYTDTPTDVQATGSSVLRRNGARPTPADLVTAIDVGTTKVCTIVGRKDGPHGIQVLAYSTVPCDGLRKGNVADVAATARAIKQSIREVEEATGHRIDSAFVGITGSHIAFENRRDRLRSTTDRDVITDDDLNGVPTPSSDLLKQPGRRLIQIVKKDYTVDGKEGIRNPVGMHSDRIEVDTHLVTGATSFIGRLADAVASAGIKVTSLVLEPLASGLAVMTPEERERGALLVDIGGGTTDLVGFSRGHVCYTGVIPVGGFQFTNDIVITFNTTFEAAEDVKLRYASTGLHSRALDQDITLPVVGRDIALKLQPGEISQLTRERAQELAQLIRIKLDEDRVDAAVRSRIVLTGGTSNLSGLAELMHRSLSMPVRKGVPEARGAFPAELKDPIYATGVGILLWALDEYVPPVKRAKNEANAGTEARSTGFMAGLFRRIGRLIPGFFFTARKGRS